MDQTIEQTMNRDSKTKGGIILNRGAVQRWILTVHDRAKTSQTCREITGLYDAKIKHTKHKDASVPNKKKDKDDVHKVMDPFKSRDPIKSLSNIAFGVKSSDDIADHLLDAEQWDNNAFTTLVEKRLQTSDVDFLAPLLLVCHLTPLNFRGYSALLCDQSQ